MEINTALLLVGGKGSRLYPLTKTRPKPLVCFLDKPIIEYQIDALVRAGIKKVILALNYFSEQIINKAKMWEKEYNITIIYSQEKEVLGTGGPIKLAEKHISGDAFILMNTDIYSLIDINELINKYKAMYKNNGEIQALLTATTVDDPSNFGLLKVENGRITQFLEKPKVIQKEAKNFINAGIYILCKKVIEKIELREISIEKDVFPGIAEESKMFIFDYENIWADIGVPKAYLKGQKMALDNLKITPDKRILDCVKSFHIENNCFYRNCEIGKNTKLTNCTLFGGCKIGDGCVINNAILGTNVTVMSGTRINKGEEVVVIEDNEVVDKHIE